MLKKILLVATMAASFPSVASYEATSSAIPPVLRASPDFIEYVKNGLGLKPVPIVMPYGKFKVAIEKPSVIFTPTPNIFAYYGDNMGVKYKDIGIKIEQSLSLYVKDNPAESWDDKDSMTLSEIKELVQKGKGNLAISSPVYSVSGMALMKQFSDDTEFLRQARSYSLDESSMAFEVASTESLNMMFVDTFIGDYLKRVGIISKNFKRIEISDASPSHISILRDPYFGRDIEASELKDALKSVDLNVSVSKPENLDLEYGARMIDQAKELYNSVRKDKNIRIATSLKFDVNKEYVSEAISDIKSGSGWIEIKETDSISLHSLIETNQSITDSLNKTLSESYSESVTNVIFIVDSEDSLPKNFGEEYMEAKRVFEERGLLAPKVGIIAIGNFEKSRLRSISGMTKGSMIEIRDSAIQISSSIDAVIAQ